MEWDSFITAISNLDYLLDRANMDVFDSFDRDFGGTLSKDRLVRSWANILSLVFITFLLVISSLVLPAAFWQVPIVLLVLLAAYLTWKQLTFHGIFERHNRRVFQGKGTDEVKV